MRTLTGIEQDLLKCIVQFPRPVAMIPNELRPALSDLSEMGLIWLKGGNWTATESGEDFCRKFAGDQSSSSN